MKIIAHRGSRYIDGYIPNTIEVFRYVLDNCNIDGIEGDFHLTLDDKIVCIHDKHLGIYGYKDKIVSKCTLNELKALSKAKIPTLEEVFETIRGTNQIFYIEIKSDIKIISTLVRQIKHAKIDIRKLMIISFDSDVLRQIKQHMDIKTLYLIENIDMKDIDKHLQIVKDIKANGVGVSSQFQQKEIIELIQKKCEYHVWQDGKNIDDGTNKFFSSLGVESFTMDM